MMGIGLRLRVVALSSIILLGSLPGVVVAEWMDWSVLGVVEAGSDDNVSIAADEFEQDDIYLTTRLQVSRARILDLGDQSSSRLRWSANLGRTFYSDWSDLTRSCAGGALQFRHKFGIGADVPRLLLAASSAYEKVRDSDRDAWHHALQLGVSRRFSERLDLGANLWFRVRDGGRWDQVDPELGSDVYDSDHYELQLTGFYALAQNVRLGLSASYLDGDFDSGCGGLLGAGYDNEYGAGGPSAGMRPPWYNYDVKALAEDQVFACRWRLDGDGYAVRGELNWRLSRVDSLKFRAGYREIELDHGQDYSNVVYTLAYSHRF